MVGRSSSSRKAQGALEYLIILSAVLSIAAVVVLFVTGSFSTQKKQATLSQCRQAAAQCKSEKLISPTTKCPMCEEACKDPVTGEIVAEGALDLCKEGEPQKIGARCGDGKCEVNEDSFGCASDCSTGLEGVSWWNAESGSGTILEDSWGDNNGVTNNSEWVTSMVGNGTGEYALEFSNGGSHVSVSNNDNLNPSTISVAAWVKPTATLNNTDRPIVSKWKEDSNDTDYYLMVSEGAPRFGISDGTNGNYTTSGVDIPVDSWSHIVGTYDGAELQIYVDGTLQGFSTFSGDLNNGTAELRIADFQNWGANYTGWEGSIDEVAIFDRVLSEDEINDIRQNGLY